MRLPDFWQSCIVIQGSISPRGKNRVTVRRNFALLIPLPRIGGYEPDLLMSDRPLPQENLFLGSVVDQRATSDVVSALYEVPSLSAAIPYTHMPLQTLFRSGTSSVSGYTASLVKKCAFLRNLG